MYKEIKNNMIIKSFENFEYPKDIPTGLNKEKLYASGDKSTPGERLRNFMGPVMTYFELDDLVKDDDDEKLKQLLEDSKQKAIDNIPYIMYWLRKIT
jgi:hypothetical protein